MTAPQPPDLQPADLTVAQARELTAEIDALVNRIDDDWGELVELITRAYRGRVWVPLQYASWEHYCRARFLAVRAVPRQVRDAMVVSLRDAGLSLRAVAATAGVSAETVRKTVGVSGVQKLTPERVQGIDGRSYPPRLRVVHRDDAPRGEPTRDEQITVRVVLGELGRDVDRAMRGLSGRILTDADRDLLREYARALMERAGPSGK
ncbi:MAG: hypothetical protein ACRDRG_14535 [Pseudonocardiaceae bacterium]